MLYENYQKKIQKIALYLSWIVKHLTVILIVAGALLAATITLLATKGLTGGVDCPSQLLYGEAYACHASSFLSGVRYEYKRVGDEEWSQTAPIRPGDYAVRAVGVSSFGKDRYGKESLFTILPKPLNVWVADTSIVFGEIPTVTSDPLCYGDRLAGTGVSYADLAQASTSVTPDLAHIRIVDANGEDVTDAYQLQPTTGTLAFTKRPLTVHVFSSSKIYDAIPFLYDEYQFDNGTTLGAGDEIDLIFPTLTDAGVIANAPQISLIHTQNGKSLNVTHQYEITILAGELKVEQKTVNVQTGSLQTTYNGKEVTHTAFEVAQDGLVPGHTITATAEQPLLDCGSYPNTLLFCIRDENGRDVSHNYWLAVTRGTIQIDRAPITVTTASGSWVYDDKAHGVPGFQATGLVAGHTASLSTTEDGASPVKIPTAVINVGSYENRAYIAVTDENGRNVTGNYLPTYQYGSLEITARPLTVTTPDVTVVYDGSTYASLICEVDGLVDGHQYQAQSAVSRTDAGIGENALTVTVRNARNVNVTSNYEITYRYGSLKILPRQLTILTGSLQEIYDGEWHSTTAYLVTSEIGFVLDHTLQVTSSTTIKNAGTENNVFLTYRILDGKGNEVPAGNYDIHFRHGTLTILPRPILLMVENTYKVYDGTPLYGGDYAVSPDSPYPLVAGHELSATVVGSRTDAGESPSRIQNVRITENGINVTANYEIITTPGTITVLPRPILLESASAEKYYDGSPLTAPSVSLADDSEYPLVSGHRLTARATGSQIKVGESENTIAEGQVRISSTTGDVTHNYALEFRPGTLTVKPHAVIVVRAESDVKMYDGKPLTNGNYTTEITEGALLSGHRIIVSVKGSITLPGTEENVPTARVVNRYAQDVSDYYTIQEVAGTLRVIDEDEDEQVMTVGMIKNDRNGYVYLRMHNYGSFDGRLWSSAIPYGKTLPGNLSYNYLASLALLNAKGNINVVEFEDLTIPMLPYYMGLDGDYMKPTDDTVYNNGLSSFIMSYYSIPSNKNGFDYLKGNLGEYAAYEEEYRQFVYANYLAVDETSRNYLQTLIDEQGFSADNPTDILRAAKYIQGAATYTTEYDRQIDVAPNMVIAFLEEYKEGKCTHYATAATLLYRTMGIPARYVEGFMVKTIENTFVPIETPGHAWVEVYIDGVGWIQVEVTGSDGNHQEKETITLTPSYCYKNYDGTPLYPENKVDADAVLSKLLEEGYTYEVAISGVQLLPGKSESKILSFILLDPSGKDVTNRYEYKIEPGVLQVFPRDQKFIRVYLYQLQKYYDGTPLSFGDDDFEIIENPGNVKLSLSLNISLTEAGSITLSTINMDIAQYASYRIYSNGRDVTSEYVLIFDVFESTTADYVPIRIDKRIITLSSASQTKVYDGKMLTNPSVTISQGSLVSGHQYKAIASGYITEPGSAMNTLDESNISLVDRAGNDVSMNYLIKIVEGTLTVLPTEEDT